MLDLPVQDWFFDGGSRWRGQWRAFCEVEERFLEGVSVLSGSVDAAHGREMAGDSGRGGDLCSARVLPPGVLRGLVWAGDLSVEPLDWVSVAEGRPGAGSHGWRVAPDQGLGRVQAFHSPPP